MTMEQQTIIEETKISQNIFSLSVEEVRSQIKAVLPESVDFADDDNLLEVGLDSLKIMRLVGQWRKSGAQATFAELIAKPQLKQWWSLLTEGVSLSTPTPVVLSTPTEKEPEAVEEQNHRGPFALTDVQYAYWIGRRDEQPLGGVGCHAYLELDGRQLEPERLEKAWRQVLHHHPMLRARFLSDGRQEILSAPVSDRLVVHDLRSFSEEKAAIALNEIRDRLSHRRLAVDQGKVAGLECSLLARGETRLHFDVDLLVADVQSLHIILRDLTTAYGNGRLPEASRHWNFAEYLYQEAQRLSKNREEDCVYWQEKLTVLPGAPSLPLKQQPSDIQRPVFKRRTYQVKQIDWQLLQKRAAKYHVTPAMVLLTVYAEIIDRWSTQSKFFINIPLFDRQLTYPGIEDVVADFTNLLLLAVDFTSDTSFLKRVRDIQTQFHKDVGHSSFSGIQVQRDLAKIRQGEGIAAPIVFASNLGNPLLDKECIETLGDLTYMISQTPQVWLDFQIYENSDGLLLAWDAVEDLFPDNMIDAMFEAYIKRIEGLVTEQATWHELVVLPLPVQQQQTRDQVNKLTEESVVPRQCLHTAFFVNAAASPQNIALIDSYTKKQFSYGELAQIALLVAGFLRENGVEQGDTVAVTLPRGSWQVAAVLGILALGACYVPVSPEQPAARRDRIYAKANIAYVLTNERLSKDLSRVDGPFVLAIEKALHGPSLSQPVELSPDNSAYIIFTSGSTGEPKGVEMSHAAAWNTVGDINQRYVVNAADRILAVAALDFDLSVYDIFGLLGAGGSLVLIRDEERRDVEYWLKMMREYRISMWNSVPVLLDMLLVAAESSGDDDLSLRLVMLSGDWIGMDLPARLAQVAPNCRFSALGGATEAAIWSNYYDVVSLPLPKHWKSIPYGRPLSNQQYRVVDKKGRICPDWVTGELWIGGAGVARGYRGMPQQTAEQFVERDGIRWYRTGDLGRYFPDGTLEFLGREDFQVKIRGHRIELGEIEKAMRQHPQVHDVVVTAIENEGRNKYLVGYIVPEKYSSGDLFKVSSIDADRAERLRISAEEAGERRAHVLPEDEKVSLYSEFWQGIEGLAAQCISRTLNKMGIFTQANECLSVEQLVQEYSILPEYKKLITQWLEVLTEEGLLERQGADTYRSLFPLPGDSLEANWQMIGENAMQDEDAAVLFQYFKTSYEHHVAMFRGEIKPLELFFPEGSWKITESLYQFNPIADYYNKTVAEIIKSIAGNIHTETPLRILELGAGTGGTAASLLPVLSSEHTEYTYTDLTAFFTDRAKEKFKDFQFMEYAILDIDQEPGRQGISPHSYDVVVAANVLHDARNIETTMRFVRKLLAPGGFCVILEGTRNIRLQMISIGFIEGLSHFEDMRLENNLPLLSTDQWRQVLLSAGFETMSSFPENNSLGMAFFEQHILVAQAPMSVQEFYPEAMAAFLDQRLPEYMVPSVFLQLETLPLNENGKVNRKKLPLPETGLDSAKRSHTDPRSALETELASIWRQVLKNEKIGVHDNFFEQGGDSLLAIKIVTSVKEAFGVKLPLESIFEDPTIAELGSQIQKLQGLAAAEKRSISWPRILPDRDAAYLPFPLTDIQQAYLVGRSGDFELGKVASHCYFELEGHDLDTDQVNLAWQRLIDRHDMMRAVILPDGRQQVLTDPGQYKIRISDLRAMDVEVVQSQLRSLRDEMSHQVLSPETWPLFDVRISLLPKKRIRLHISFDNLIFDGWSMFHLLSEWRRLYRDIDVFQKPLEVSFRDYVLAVQQLKTSRQYQEDREYWFGRLPDLPPAPELPLAKSPKSIEEQRFNRLETRLDRATWQALQKKITTFGLSPSSLLLSVYAEVLAYWSKSPRFTINLTLFNRLPLHDQINDIVGDFTSLVLLAIDNSKGTTFLDRVRCLQQQLWQDLDHLLVSGVEVQRELVKHHGKYQGSAMPVVFTSALGVDQGEVGISDSIWLGKLVYNISQTPQVWLDHQVYEQEGELFLNWDAVDGLFPKGMLEDMFTAYCGIIRKLADDKEQWHQPLFDLLPERQRARRLEVDATESLVSSELLHSLFIRHVFSQPDHLAVVDSRSSLSYRELFLRASSVSKVLCQKGVQPGQLVAIMMGKSQEQVVAALGILIAGAAYLPVDPSLPNQRILHMLRDADVRLVLTQSSSDSIPNLPDGAFEFIETDRISPDSNQTGSNLYQPIQQSEDLAYVIYTSGSTGLPKGVMIDHRGAVNTILDINQRFGVNAKDRVLALANLSFDLSVYDIFGTLAAGGTIVLPDNDKVKEPGHWAELIGREQVTVWNSVPAMMSMLLENASNNDQYQSLRLVLLSGDWIPLELPEKIWQLAGEVEIISLGGATEASIWSNLFPITQIDKNWKSIPYGRAMSNQRLQVFNEFMKFTPDWVPGHLYISGTGLAKGYLNNPEKTDASFVEHPLTKERLYRTGDLGRYLPDGNIEFLGREDFQVKISGYRVELGEIEAAIKQHTAVKEAVVAVAVDRSEMTHLTAYIVPDLEVSSELIHARDIESKESGKLWAALQGLIRDQVEELSKRVDMHVLDSFNEYTKRMSLLNMYRALQDVALFPQLNTRYTLEELIRNGRIGENYKGLVAEWLTLLTETGLLRKEGEFFINPGGLPDRAQIDAESENIRRTGKLDESVESLNQYLDALGPHYADLLRGDVDPLTLFFDESKNISPERLAQILPAMAYMLRVAGALLQGICQGKATDQGLRILQVGSRTGATTSALLPFSNLHENRYYCSDTSPFFTETTAARFVDTPAVESFVFDPEKDPGLQGIEPHRFDVVIAVNAIHRARHIGEALRHTLKMMAPGGVLVLVEGTRDHLLQQISAGFLEQGFTRYQDRRAKSGQPFLSLQDWSSAIEDAGFQEVFFSSAPFVEVLGQNVIIAKAPDQIRTFATEELRNALRQILPEYMVPSDYTVLETIPLTPNGKIDHDALPKKNDHPLSPEDKEFIEPDTALETHLAKIWCEVLMLDRVGMTNDFFQLGGDSLLGTQITAKLRKQFGVDLPLRILFEHPTIRDLAEQLERFADERTEEVEALLPRISPDSGHEHEPFPLSDVQHAYVVGRSGMYELGNVAAHCYFEYDTEELDMDRVNAAWQRLVEHHGMLRAILTGNGKYQKILPEVPFYQFKTYDLTLLAEDDAQSELELLRQEMSHQVISTDSWPLFDIRVSLHGSDQARIHVSFDNLILDGWSMFRILNEWSRLYHNPETTLPKLEISFRDYILAESRIKETELYQRDKSYWLERIPNLPPAPDLPLVRQPEPGELYRFKRLESRLDKNLWQQLKERAQQSGLTPSGLLLAAYSEVLAAWSNSPQFTINLTMFNRFPLHEQLNDIVGDFTSLTLLAVDNAAEKSFTDRARRLQQQLWQDLDHPYYSGLEVLRKLGESDDGDRRRGMPFVFTSALGLNPSDEAAIGNNHLGQFAYGISQTPQVLIDHQVFEISNELILVWDAVHELFPQDMVKEMFAAYGDFLRRLAQEEEVWNEDIPVLLPDTQQEVRNQVNATQGERYDYMLDELFEQQVKQRPKQHALVSSSQVLSYGELSIWSEYIGQLLLKEYDAQPDQLIAVVMEKGWEQVVGTLGILKSGAAYLPLNADTPPERLRHILVDAEVSVVLTQSRIRTKLSLPADIQLISVDTTLPVNVPGESDSVDEPRSIRQPENLAYVIYTSGSTGKPKGVMIDHRGVVNTIMDVNQRYSVGADDRVFALSSLNFDLSVYDIFGTLAAGGTIVLPDPDGLKDPAHWLDLIEQEKITIWNSVPALMQMLVKYAVERPESVTPSLRQILLSGDWIPPDLPLAVKTIYPDAQIHSLGGATEASIWSITYPISQPDAYVSSIPYGRPMVNQTVYVLNHKLTYCPDWVSGSLYIGGMGLAKGYWKDTVKTAASFFIHPETGERLYATGDLGRYLPDGNIEFLGRDDFQIKIRGYRIELGEIELVLKSFPGISDVTVQVVGDMPSNRRLIGYIVPTEGQPEVDLEGLGIFAADRLPDYMLPNVYIPLKAIPLNANGKIDRRALPLPDEESGTANRATSMTPYESEVASLWKRVLKKEDFGVDDNFFMVGGDSLTAVDLANEFFSCFNVEVSLPDLFKSPTICGMAETVERAFASEEQDDSLHDTSLPQVIPAPEQRYEPFPLTEVQQAYWVGRSGAYELGNVATHSYFEIENSGIDIERFTDAWQLVIHRHEMLRTVILPDGRQKILKQVPNYELNLTDMRGQSDEVVQTHLRTVREKMEHQMHPVNTWPLFEIQLTRYEERGEEKLRIHLSFDALILDGWSMGIIFRDWHQYYLDQEANLPPLDLSYRDYVTADQAFRESDVYKRDRAYSLDRLPQLPPSPDLSLTKHLGQVERPKFSRLSFKLEVEEWGKLKQRSAENKLTPSGILIAAYAKILAVWSKKSDFTINLSFFNRLPLHPQVNDIVGDFTSMKLLAVHSQGELSFADWAELIQQQLWEELEHRHFSGVSMLRELARQRGNPGAAAMPVVFTSFLGMEQHNEEDRSAISLLGDMIYNVSQTPQVILDNQVGELNGTLSVSWDAVSEVFPEGMLEEMFAAYYDLLRRLATEEEVWQHKAVEMPIVVPVDKRNEINATAAPVSDAMLHTLFYKQAVENGSLTAVIDARRSLSYKELQHEADRIGFFLRDSGIRPNQLVAVVMEKGWEQVAAVLGILVSGGAYLPIAADTPKDRLYHLLQDSDTTTVLTQSWVEQRIDWPDNVQCFAVDQLKPLGEPPAEPEFVQRPEDLAYVIYTSGSTGLPKGVMIDHRGAVNTILDINSRFGLTPRDRVLALSGLHFDLSVYDIFGTLAAGGTIVLPAHAHLRDPGHWLKLMREHAITIWNSVPALLKMLVEFLSGKEQELPKTLRLSLLSGDWLPLELPNQIRRLFPNSEIVSLGGATEASIWSILYPVKELDPNWKSIPYGYPMVNQQLFVLDEYLNDCPDWVPGDLFIGGIGLAQGYWKDEGKTSAAFIRHPRSGDRLYKTGDLGRYLPDGSIEFLGREDSQVKINGYRVELGEIEFVLNKHPDISEAAVIAIDQGEREKILAGYLVPNKNVELSIDTIQDFLNQSLPAYMVPAAWTLLDQLPHTANGKVDRKALPEPGQICVESEEEYTAPQNDLERKITHVVQEVIGLERVSVSIQFFELGANSLDIVRMQNILSQTVKNDITVVDLFEHPTVQKLADYIRRCSDNMQSDFEPSNRIVDRKKQLRKRKKRKQG